MSVLYHRKDSVPESWNEDPGEVPVLASPIRFPYLTQLSLSWPAASVSWMDLISFARHNLGALTHLSLAHWPPPSYGKAHATVATVPSVTPFSDLVALRPDSQPLAPAFDILTSLARATPALTWLSLADCQGWLGDLLREMLLISKQGKSHVPRQSSLSNRRMPLKGGRGYSARSLNYDSFADISVGSTDRHETSWIACWHRLQFLDLGQSDLDIPFFKEEVSTLNNPLDRQNSLQVFQAPNPALNRAHWKRLMRSDVSEAYTVVTDAVDMERLLRARRAAHIYHERDWISASLLGFYMLERAAHDWKKGKVHNSIPGAVKWEMAIL